MISFSFQLHVDSSNEKIILLQLQSGTRLVITTYSANELEEQSQVKIDITWLDNLDSVR